MKTQLRSLLLLQEIDSLVGDLTQGGGWETEESLGFPLGSLSATRGKRDETARHLDPELLRRYERIRQRHARAVAPARHGVCLGCFTKRPTRTTLSRPGGIESCERCGRILFRLDE
jgi:hypothetical protein